MNNDEFMLILNAVINRHTEDQWDNVNSWEDVHSLLSPQAPRKLSEPAKSPSDQAPGLFFHETLDRVCKVNPALAEAVKNLNETFPEMVASTMADFHQRLRVGAEFLDHIAYPFTPPRVDHFQCLVAAAAEGAGLSIVKTRQAIRSKNENPGYEFEQEIAKILLDLQKKMPKAVTHKFLKFVILSGNCHPKEFQVIKSTIDDLSDFPETLRPVVKTQYSFH